MKKTILMFLFSVFLALNSSVSAQQPVHRGIALYTAGKYSEAVGVLSEAVKQPEFKTNGEMWNYLGMAYVETNEVKKARKALEKAVQLSPQTGAYRLNLGYAYILERNIDKAQTEIEKAIAINPKDSKAYYLLGRTHLWEGKFDKAADQADQVILLEPSYPLGYILKSDILIAKLGKRVTAGSTVKAEIDLIKSAVDTLTTGATKTIVSERKAVEDELESVQLFYRYFNKEKIDSADLNAPVEPGITPLKIVSKPRPQYTDRARMANVSGVIRLAILFGANGKVEHFLLLKRLGYGLDEMTLNAASKIIFEPKLKDGKPISTVRLVEYTFSIY